MRDDKIMQVSQAEKDRLIDKNDKANLFRAFTKDIKLDANNYITQKIENPNKLPDLIKFDSKEESKLSEDLIKKLKEEEAQELEKIRKIKEQEDEVSCKICLDGLSDKPFTIVNECGHVFHVSCLKPYATQKIESRNLPIKCPEFGCKGEVMLPDLEEFLESQYLEKYREFALKNYLDKLSDEVSWCPTADCPFVFINDDKVNEFTCPVCKKFYCFTCRVPFHVGQTWKEYQISKNFDKNDKNFMNLVKLKKFKQCPQCKFWIEKNERM